MSQLGSESKITLGTSFLEIPADSGMTELGKPGPPLTPVHSSALQRISDVRVRAVFKPLGMTAFERYANILRRAESTR